MSIHDDDLLASIAGHLVGGLLQQVELQVGTVRNCAGLMFSLEDLPEVVLGEYDGILLLGSMQGDIANVEQISSERQMRAVLFQDAEGQKACTLRLMNGVMKVGGGEFFPTHREFRLPPPRQRQRY